jgi:hypothetical protein
VCERRAREGGLIAEPGRPLEGKNPGEERLRGEGNTELKDERTRWRVKPLKVAERGKRSGKQLAAGSEVGTGR